LAKAYWYPTVVKAQIEGQNLIAELYVPPFYAFNGSVIASQFYSIPVSGLLYNLTVLRIPVSGYYINLPLNLSRPLSNTTGFALEFQKDKSVSATCSHPSAWP
ncbi:hypothetical protein, partial [Acidilobus sp.]|uniref:hypothetical protein n=1 Tax=Acidilobus sp. TaxID=1872109 RepID=UPI003D02C643